MNDFATDTISRSQDRAMTELNDAGDAKHSRLWILIHPGFWFAALFVVLMAGAVIEAVFVPRWAANKAALEVGEAMAGIAKMENPWAAFVAVGAARADAVAASGDLCEGAYAPRFRFDCLGLPIDSELWTVAGSYLARAVETKSAEAFEWVLRHPGWWPELVEDSRRGLAELVASNVEQGAEVAHIEQVARLLAEGELAQRDSARALRLFGVAWSLGSETAARDAVEVCRSYSDGRCEYFWALRCIGKCTLKQRPLLDDMARELGPVAVLEVERLALDKRLIEFKLKEAQ